MSNQPPSNTPSGNGPPPSPWLRKFGGHSRTVLNNPMEPLSHSGLAPRIPDLHPTFYAEGNDYLANLAPFAKPSDYELDMLFATEDFQLGMNGGLTTWELAVLNERLVNGWPGGHHQSDPNRPRLLETNGLGAQVDESSWHPVFQKIRWYDFRVPIVDGKSTRHAVSGIAATDVWSVDVPALWQELREPIELANRWFRYMAAGSWLNQLIFETRAEWMEATPASGDFNAYPDALGPNRKPYRIPAQYDHCDAERVLKHVAEKVAPVLLWTFIDDFYHTHDSTNEQDHYGRTAREWDGGVQPKEDTPRAQRPAPFITTYLHVKPLRVLLDPEATLSERCHARWSLALTILHELMHAINMSRHIDEIDVPVEPHYGEEWEREIGCSGIKSFFGTEFLEAPPSDTVGKSGYKYGLSMREWPSVPSGDSLHALNNHPVTWLGKESTTSPIPAAWLSSTLLESFYNTQVRRFGLAAFHPPRLFSCENITRGFYTEHRRAQPLANTHLNPIHATDAGVAHELAQSLADLQTRRALWSRLRPWYPEAHGRWLRTPYSNTAARATVARFAEAAHPALRMTEADAQLAEHEAHRAQSGMHYWLTRHPHRQGLDAAFPGRDWLFVVLSLMMQAVLPVRDEGVGLPYPHSRTVQNTWFPSRAADGAGNGRWRFAEKREVYPELRPVYMLGKRHKDGHVERDENGDVVRHMGNREWLLEEALKEKERAERFEPLPRPLAEALERELRSLFQQALFEKMEDEWLDWGFEFPEYSDELVTTDEVGDYVPWFELAAAAQAQGHAHRAQLVRRKRDRFKTRAWLPKTKYFTVSEVAENRSDSRTLTNWGLLPDEEGGYDVFDVTSILQNDPSIDVEGFFEKTKVGRQIVSERVVEALKAKSQKPLGKVLTWRRPEEISEHDGQDGRNLWCVIGNIVYDITNFRFHSEAERKALTAVATGQKTAAEGLHAFDIPALLRRLAVYKCGYLKQAAGLEPGERTFTLRELGRYIYPEVGMYCAVNNVILDLGRYLESHPGGSEILRQYAGRDASVEFENAHSDSQRLLLEYENLRVGWIVYDLFDHNHIKPDELMLFDRAYNITMIARDDTEDFYHALLRHAGTDATEALKDEAPPYALRQLLTRDDMVTAKRPPAMRDITAAELRNHGYIPSRAERREKPGPRDQSWRVWVSAVAGELGNASAPLKKMVFDVTAMVMFGGPELEQKLRPWLGKEVGDDGVADMLCSRQYESFIIGRLVESESSVPEKALAKPKGRVQSQAVAGSKRQADSLSEGSPGSTGQSKRRSTRGRERA